MLALVSRSGRARAPPRDLLVAALQRAVALAQVTALPLPSPKTWISMCRGLPRYARCRPRRRRRRPWPRSGSGQASSIWPSLSGDLHAAPAAAGGRLDQHRIADLSSATAGFILGIDATRRSPGTTGMPSRFGLLGLDLVAHDADVLGCRADEGDAVLLEDLGEAGVFRQEAVARVDRVGAGDLAGRHDGRNVEIAVGRGGGPMQTLSSASRTCIAWHRRWSGRRRSGCPARGRRGGRAARSRRGWRSGPFEHETRSRLNPLLDDHQRFAELDRFAVPRPVFP
jgi:hypothetical protein